MSLKTDTLITYFSSTGSLPQFTPRNIVFIFALCTLVSQILTRKTSREDTDFREYQFVATVQDCVLPGNTTDKSFLIDFNLTGRERHAKLTFSYTTLKADPTVIMIGVYARLLTCAYSEDKVVSSGDVLQTIFFEDINGTIINKNFNGYYKDGSMGWGDVLLIDRVETNLTWLMPEKVPFDPQMVALGYTALVANQGVCMHVTDVVPFNKDAKSLQFTLFYIFMVVCQISAVVVIIGLVQIQGGSYIATTPRFSLICCWIVDVQLIILTLVYLPCYIYAFIGQIFVVLFSIISSNPHFMQENEEDMISITKRVIIAFFSVLMFSGQIYLLFWEPNLLPFYCLAGYFFLVLDNFFNYCRSFKYVYIFGIYLPKTLIIWYIFYFPNPLHMGPTRQGELFWLVPALLILIGLVVFQAVFHPRFYLTTEYERQLMKLIPKSFRIEDLMKERPLGEDEVCGICLEPFHVSQQRNPSIHSMFKSETGNNSRLEETGTQNNGGLELSRDMKRSLLEESDRDHNNLQAVAMANQNEQELNNNADIILVDSIIDKTHCNHLFHRSCLRAWVEKSESCPICREVVITEI